MRGVKALRFWGRLIVICKGHPATAYLRAKRSQSSLHTGLEVVPVKVANHQLETVNTIDGRSTRPAASAALPLGSPLALASQVNLPTICCQPVQTTAWAPAQADLGNPLGLVVLGVLQFLALHTRNRLPLCWLSGHLPMYFGVRVGLARNRLVAARGLLSVCSTAVMGQLTVIPTTGLITGKKVPSNHFHTPFHTGPHAAGPE